jgi:hypothetical protein
MTSTAIRHPRRWAILASLALTGCESAPAPGLDVSSPNDPATRTVPRLSCDAAESDLFAGGPGRDAVPSLQKPDLVPADDPAASYLDAYERNPGEAFWPTARVIGLEIEAQHKRRQNDSVFRASSSKTTSSCSTRKREVCGPRCVVDLSWENGRGTS